MSRTQHNISVATRVTATLILLSLASAAIAHIAIGVPGRTERELQQRTVIGRTLASTCAPLASRESDEQLKACLTNFGTGYRDILNARVYTTDGIRLANWRRSDATPGHGSRVILKATTLSFPIVHDGNMRGTLHVGFRPTRWLRAIVSEPAFLAAAITFALNGLFFRWHIGRVLNLFDPVSAVPQHVRSTLDSFSEGVAILDDDGNIILANEALIRYFAAEKQPFVGQNIDDFDWVTHRDNEPLPWKRTDQRSDDSAHRVLLNTSNDRTFTFRVRLAPIHDDMQHRVGAIVCFDDVTAMEEKREALRLTLAELQQSRDELTMRNQELQILATRDPLTSCLNRRTFFELFDKHWHMASHADEPLSCAMLDIDFFKSINDNHGHQVGDDVLRSVGSALHATVHKDHVVCRYGGEEFCVLMPTLDINEAEQVSESIRKAISKVQVGKLSISVSVGVSATSLGAVDPQALIDQADKCLYVAKRSGRNQVVRWDDVPENIDELNAQPSAHPSDMAIPYPAVASLMSALAYRHPDTAAHCVRVAELAVITARDIMSAKEAYVLEIGSLLHDIGKIGVPDTILLKPGPLTVDEWDLMRIHDRIGVEIIESSFAHAELVDIVRYHHAWFGGNPRSPRLPTGKDIPLGARIVAIADAYDAIISDRVYRKGRSQQEAFAELRRSAGEQFDPNLVERFIKVVEDFRSLELPVGSKYNALQISLQIERLSKAIDEQDRLGIIALATRLEATSAHCKIDEIQHLASELKRAATNGEDVDQIVDMTRELVDLCRSTQRAYVDIDLWDAAETQREFLAFD